MAGYAFSSGCLVEEGAAANVDVEEGQVGMGVGAIEVVVPEGGVAGDGPPITQDLVAEGLDAQIIAQAACTAMRGPEGWTFAVRRDCSAFAADCATTCANIVEGQAGQLKCFNSLHVYGNDPHTSPATIGLKTYRYNSCGGDCGPNYCCCGN